jgi:hypothetical protein
MQLILVVTIKSDGSCTWSALLELVWHMVVVSGN